MKSFNRKLLHIINKPLFISGDCNWLNLLNDAITTYNNNIHSTINITLVDASNNPDKVKYVRKPASQIITSSKHSYNKPKLLVGNYVRNDDKRYIFYKGHTSKWKRVLFKINKILSTQPETFKIDDINGEIIEGEYYEQELLISYFDFESNNKVLESLGVDLRSARK